MCKAFPSPTRGLFYIYISQNVMYTPQSYFRPLLGAYFFIKKSKQIARPISPRYNISSFSLFFYQKI